MFEHTNTRYPQVSAKRMLFASDIISVHVRAISAFTTRAAGRFTLRPTDGTTPRRATAIAPTQPGATVRQAGTSRVLSNMRWGLIPYWAKDASMGNRLINARSETVLEKPAFREVTGLIV